jgi:hypothetical protein
MAKWPKPGLERRGLDNFRTTWHTPQSVDGISGTGGRRRRGSPYPRIETAEREAVTAGARPVDDRPR